MANNNFIKARFCVRYLGQRPIATRRIEDMFLPIMRVTHTDHAEVLWAVYLGGGAPERAEYDLEYMVMYDGDTDYWNKQMKWWKEKLNLLVEIKADIN